MEGAGSGRTQWKCGWRINEGALSLNSAFRAPWLVKTRERTRREDESNTPSRAKEGLWVSEDADCETALAQNSSPPLQSTTSVHDVGPRRRSATSVHLVGPRRFW